MSSEAVEEVKNEEVAEIANTEVNEDTSPEARVLRDASAEASRGIRDSNEEQHTEQIKQYRRSKSKSESTCRLVVLRMHMPPLVLHRLSEQTSRFDT